MKCTNNYLGISALVALLASQAYAEDTIVVEEDAAPEEIVGLLELPEDASDTARENAAAGLETANAAREDGRAFGEAMAEGRAEAGLDIAEAAQAAAEARQSAAEIVDEAQTKAGRP